jgi:hypothetical protein
LPARIFTWIDGINSNGAESPASRASRMETNSSSLMPSLTCGLLARSSPTVVSQA